MADELRPAASNPQQPDEPKTPPNPEQIQALLQMAEMQAMGGKARAKSPYRALFIVLGVTVLVMAGAYVLLTWAARHY